MANSGARLEGVGRLADGRRRRLPRSVKHDVLDVTSVVVSSIAAGQMAAAVRRLLGADVGIVVTGVDGGDGPVTLLAELDGEPEQNCDAVTAPPPALAAAPRRPTPPTQPTHRVPWTRPSVATHMRTPRSSIVWPSR